MPEERQIEVNGIPFRWVEDGEGLPVVLIHGIPTSPALWRHVMPLVPAARLLAFEMVGYGLSWQAGRERDISVKAQAGYLLRWLEALGVQRAVFAGHDLGGGVAQIAAARERGRCAGLVLTNSIGYDSWPIPSVTAVQKLGGLVSKLPSALFRQQLRFFIAQGHDDRARAAESLEAHWPGYDHPEGAAAFVRQVRSLRAEDTLEVAGRLPELGLPAAVVWGAADRFQKVEYGRRLASDLGTQAEEVAQGKHFMPEDHPDEVAAAVRSVAEAAPTAP